MALADLLSKLETEDVDTADTSCNGCAVSAKPLQDKACTPDTADTSQNINVEDCGVEAIPDDRRTCRQCGRWSGGICTIAAPGGLVSARRGYRPRPDLLQRCKGFSPLSGDPDQRKTSERWPNL